MKSTDNKKAPSILADRGLIDCQTLGKYYDSNEFTANHRAFLQC